MTKLIDIPTHKDNRGSLSVIDSIIPFEIKRVYYIFDATAPRGGHSHKYSSTFLIALNGKVVVNVQNKSGETRFVLNTPNAGLLINPGDWINYECDSGAVLLCLSSHLYNTDDYVYKN